MKKFAPAMIIAAGVLWGVMGIFVRKLNAMGLSSVSVSEVRALSTTVVMAVTLLIFKKSLFRIKLRDLWIFAGGGIFSIVFFNVCYFNAIELMSLSAAAILMYTSPAFVLILSAILFRERVTKIKILSIVLTFAGCALVGGLLSGNTVVSFVGVLYGIGSGLGYALYSIFSMIAIQRNYHPLTITFYIFMFAAIGSMIIGGVGEIAAVVAEAPSRILFFILYVVVTTVGPYVMYTAGLEYVENSKASVIVAVEPVMATVVGLVIYDESLTIATGVGIILVLAAIVLLGKSDENTEKE